ncbi:hypothetical protein AC1031_021979 [Aphanomyces cochlioides]|nr:hypothetical protein AC1031_021979 [Aphanomyces cochlioides]
MSAKSKIVSHSSSIRDLPRPGNPAHTGMTWLAFVVSVSGAAIFFMQVAACLNASCQFDCKVRWGKEVAEMLEVRGVFHVSVKELQKASRCQLNRFSLWYSRSDWSIRGKSWRSIRKCESSNIETFQRFKCLPKVPRMTIHPIIKPLHHRCRSCVNHLLDSFV